MIDLALLCNLYADGPTTLGRLRELGCETLESVEALSAEDLGWALQSDDDVCERFRREAGLLRERRGVPKATSAVIDGAESANAEGRGADGPGSKDRADVPSGSDETAVARNAVARNAGPATDRDAEAAPRREGSLLDVLLRAWRRASGRSDAADGAGAEGDGAVADGAVADGAVSNRDATAREPGGGQVAPTAGVARASVTRETAPSYGATATTPVESRVPDEPQVELPRPATPSAAAVRTSAPATGSTAPEATPAAPAPNTTPIEAADAAAPTAAPSPTPVAPTPVAATPSGVTPGGVAPGAVTPSTGSGLGAPTPAESSRAATPPASGTPLMTVGFDGIEAEYAEQLGALGIATVEEFLAAQPLDLAGRSTMRYTVLLRMQFTARREASGSR